MFQDDAEGLFRRMEITRDSKRLVRRKRKEIQRFIRKENFMTGLVELPELGLRVNLGPNQFYRLEVTSDLFEREEEIQDYYAQRHATVHHVSRSRLNGLCIPLSNLPFGEQCRANVILVKAGLEDPTRTYVIGHENGHFIFDMGLKGQFYKHYSVPQRIQDQIVDSEDFGMFCGNIAMANAGYNLTKINSVSPSLEILEKEKRVRGLVIEIIPEQFYNSLFRQRGI